MLTIVMLMGSIGGSSAFAAETTDESSTAESIFEETAGETDTPHGAVNVLIFSAGCTGLFRKTGF